MEHFNLHTQSQNSAPLENGAELDFQKSKLPSMDEVRRREAEIARHFKIDKSREKMTMTIYTEAKARASMVNWARGRRADLSRPLNAQTDLGTAENYEFTGRQS